VEQPEEAVVAGMACRLAVWAHIAEVVAHIVGGVVAVADTALAAALDELLVVVVVVAVAVAVARRFVE
jgi:hypothetical protein